MERGNACPRGCDVLFDTHVSIQWATVPPFLAVLPHFQRTLEDSDKIHKSSVLFWTINFVQKVPLKAFLQPWHRALHVSWSNHELSISFWDLYQLSATCRFRSFSSVSQLRSFSLMRCEAEKEIKSPLCMMWNERAFHKQTASCNAQLLTPLPSHKSDWIKWDVAFRRNIFHRLSGELMSPVTYQSEQHCSWASPFAQPTNVSYLMCLCNISLACVASCDVKEKPAFCAAVRSAWVLLSSLECRNWEDFFSAQFWPEPPRRWC